MADSSLDKKANEIYGNRVRVRVCGLCWSEEKLLLVNHHGLYGHDFWAPPGGGIDFGQPADANLRREFEEETGVTIEVGKQLFVCEFVKSPLHAVELFFQVRAQAGRIAPGRDPEMGVAQIINAVRFISIPEILRMPESHRHGIFRFVESAESMRALQGYFKI